MIVFINGSINSGKSTVAKILVDKLKNTAHLEVDNLRDFIEWMPLDKAIPINLENAVSLIKNFSVNKLNVVVTYPLSEKNYEFMLEKLKDLNENIFFITLNPDLNIVSKDRGNRKLDNWEKTRIKYHYKIGINNPSFGIKINTTKLTPDQTAEEIIKIINY
jgi:uridine kinase